MKILLTNDDSHRSPLLEFIIDKLCSMGALTVVVPEREQSWKGKALSRFESVHLKEISLFGHPAYSVDGTPADCVNIGIHHLTPEKPDLVVSGINAGLNTGMSFVFSSGTIGAALEANIAGVPGIAFSQCFDSETMARYVSDYHIVEKTISRLRAQTKELLDRFFTLILAHPEFLARPITWNVNFPISAGKETQVKIAALGRSVYGSYFSREGNIFSHKLQNVGEDTREDSDTKVLHAGHVTITPLDMCEFGRGLSAEIKALIELMAKAQATS